MVKLTPQLISSLIGQMYIQISHTEESLSYMSGWICQITTLDECLKNYVLTRSQLNEVPLNKRFCIIKKIDYDESLTDNERIKFNRGYVDANNFMYYHIHNYKI